MEHKTGLEDYYVIRGQKKMRFGYTTGSCAAAACKGACLMLLGKEKLTSVPLMTPKGILLDLELHDIQISENQVTCAVKKDAGDDPDTTNGILVYATVWKTDTAGIVIDGGVGVGRVTRPGLSQKVGEAAINPVPRAMILREAEEAAVSHDYEGGLKVVISVPEGVEIGKKTFNPRLGITGGISILGTSGIVEPMSIQAMIDTLQIELRQTAAQGHRGVILTPGNYGQDFLRQCGWGGGRIPVIRCSNFVGEALDGAAAEGFKRVLLVGHVGKLVKLAGGIMNTHSRWGDCRTELFCAHAAVCGAGQSTCQALLEGATTDACLEILEQAGLREAVMARLMDAIEAHVSRRVGGAYRVGVILFSHVFGELGRTPGTQEVLKQWEQEEEFFSE